MEKARELGVLVVNYLWLQDLYIGLRQPVQEMENSRYALYDTMPPPEVNLTPSQLEKLCGLTARLMSKILFGLNALFSRLAMAGSRLGRHIGARYGNPSKRRERRNRLPLQEVQVSDCTSIPNFRQTFLSNFVFVNNGPTGRMGNSTEP